jgi:type VI secretion system secreted protein VgrG
MTPVTFTLQVDGLDSDAIRVVRLDGEERLTRPYRFDVDVVSANANLAVETLLAKTATLTLARGSSSRNIHGVIFEASEAGQAPGDVYAYRFQLVPRISLLALSHHNRSFGTQTAQSVLDVIQSVLSDPSGIGLGQSDWSISVLKPESYPKRDFWAQYDESDFDFVHRLLEHWGIYYFFDQADTHETIVFSDSTALAPAQAIDGTLVHDGHHDAQGYGGGVVLTMSRRIRVVSKSVSLSDYNDQTPDRPVTAQAQVPAGSSGTYNEYAAHFRDDAEGEVFARARAEEIGGRRDVFEIETDSPFAAPGLTFTISQSFRRSFNQTYLPTVIRHSGQQPLAGAFSQAKAPGTPGYHNRITAIPATVAWRSPRLLRRPVMAGVMPAVIDAPDKQGERAVLDAGGRYKIALNFDSTVNPAYSY